MLQIDLNNYPRGYIGGLVQWYRDPRLSCQFKKTKNKTITANQLWKAVWAGEGAQQLRVLSQSLSAAVGKHHDLEKEELIGSVAYSFR